MRFIVDECVGPVVARWLRDNSHDVFSVYEEARGVSDDEVAARALGENRILVTNDKEFASRVFRAERVHPGVVLLRLGDEKSENKIAALQRLLNMYPDRLAGQLVVVTEGQVRFARMNFP